MNNKSFYTIAGILVVASIAFWAWMFQGNDTPETQTSPDAETEAFYEPTVMEDSGERYDGDVSLTMYSSEGCTCCVKWADYLEDNGMEVTVEKVDNLNEIKEENGVPNRLSSCHTALVDGYVVEGHVPVDDIRRLLAEQPDAIGVAVPGMPPNSPGMDQPVDREYQSVLFTESDLSVFNTHN
ncbi:MAG: DUF411 domain-containing protein [Balneolaceae bacterium]